MAGDAISCAPDFTLAQMMVNSTSRQHKAICTEKIASPLGIRDAISAVSRNIEGFMRLKRLLRKYIISLWPDFAELGLVRLALILSCAPPNEVGLGCTNQLNHIQSR